MDQDGDPCRSPTTAGGRGAGKPRRALASDSGRENAGSLVPGGNSPRHEAMCLGCGGSPLPGGVGVQGGSRLLRPPYSIHGPEGCRCFVGISPRRLLRSSLEKSG